MSFCGLTHIYCGQGKGKTTAAFGLALRCVGYGERVLILQFLKGWDSGELRAISRFPEVEILRGDASDRFIFQMDEEEKKLVLQQNNDNIKQAKELIQTGEYRLIVLDEIMAAWSCNMIDRDLVLDLLSNKPDDMEVVMTGQNPPDCLLEKADYISEIQKIRHPYDRGVIARKFIEF